MLQMCLHDVELLQILTSAAEDFARAAVPRVVFKAFQQGNMTALLKMDGGVRGIAPGTSFRRLVANVQQGSGTSVLNLPLEHHSAGWWRKFSKEVERACAPFQFALSTRAGTDCVGHVIRALSLGIHDAQSKEAKNMMGEEEHLLGIFGRRVHRVRTRPHTFGVATLWDTGSPRGQGSICMRAKHGCGTEKAHAHPEWRSLGLRCGAHGE